MQKLLMSKDAEIFKVLLSRKPIMIVLSQPVYFFIGITFCVDKLQAKEKKLYACIIIFNTWQYI